LDEHVQVGPKQPSSSFLALGLRDLRHNLSLTWPIVVIFAAFILVSGSVFYLWLGGRTSAQHWGEAVYQTWLATTTAGGLVTTSIPGRILGGADTLVGLIFFGFVVWLVTESLHR
jgi:hypothetical protein